MKVQDATSFITNIDSVDYKVKPNLHAVIKLNNVSFEWLGNQHLFNAKIIEIETNNPLCVYTKNFNINKVTVKSGTYSDQILEDGTNKLAVLPRGFDPRPFGAKKIKVTAGPVMVKNCKVKYITPTTYNEEKTDKKTYSKAEVKNLLKNANFSFVKVN